MAVKKSKKTAKKSNGKLKVSLSKVFGKQKKSSFFKRRTNKKKATPTQLLGRWLIVSLAVNLVLGILVLLAHSNPTSYTDAAAGYTISLPAGWKRTDTANGAIKLEYGKSAKIIAFGQRAVATGFYDQSQANQDSILNNVVNQINAGSNQFVLPDVGLSAATYKAERTKQAVTGDEEIKITFNGVNKDGDKVQGEQLILITRSGGGLYNILGIANQNEWPQVQSEIERVINTFDGV